MNTYLLPISDSADCWIECVHARSFQEAEDKFVKIFTDDYDFVEIGSTLSEVYEQLREHNIIIGEVYDSEEF